MNKRNLLIIVAWLICLGTVSVVLAQRSQLASLRAQRQQVGEPPATPKDLSSSGSGAVAPAPADNLSPEGSRELLQLRAQVTKLTARKRELSGVAEAGEKLRAQLAGSPTGSGGIPLPAGYIRRANAQFVGYSTPEATVQSWLWALQNHHFVEMLQALSPAEVQNAQARMEAKGDSDKFFKEMDSLPGIAIQGRRNLPDGSVELQVYVAPNLSSQKIPLQLINGEWKMAGW